MSSHYVRGGDGSIWNETALLAQSGNKRMVITPGARANFRTLLDSRGGGEYEETGSMLSGMSASSQGMLAGNVYRVGGLTRELVEKLQESEREGSLSALPPNIDYVELKPGDAPPKGFAWEASSKKKGKPRINLIPDSIRKIAGIRSVSEKSMAALDPSLRGESEDMDSVPWDSKSKQLFMREVEIWKTPGDTLGFYVSRGDGHERSDGVFLTRLILGSYVERLGLLQVGDEILAINGIPVGDMPLQNVVMLMKYVQRLVLTVKAPTGWSHLYRKFNRRSKSSKKPPPVPPPAPQAPLLIPTQARSKSKPRTIPFPSADSFESRPRTSSYTDAPGEVEVASAPLVPIHTRGFSDIAMPNSISYQPPDLHYDLPQPSDHQHSLSSNETFQHTGSVVIQQGYLVRREQPKHLRQTSENQLLDSEQLDYLAQLERDKHIFMSEDVTLDSHRARAGIRNPIVLPLHHTNTTDGVTYKPTNRLYTAMPNAQPFEPETTDPADTDLESAPATEGADSESMPDTDRADTPSLASVSISREGSVVSIPPLPKQEVEMSQEDVLLPKIYIS